MGNIETIDPNLNKPIDEVQKTFDGSVTQNPQTTTLATINTSDTISQFMEKVNNNFTTIISMGGGPAGVEGEKGDPGAPTKPKVFVHAWRLGYEFRLETEITENKYELVDIQEDLTNCKYQEGHIIILQNAHVYRLELNTNTYKLEPKFLIALQSYDPSSVVNGKTAYMHIAYSNSDDGSTDFITDKELRENTKGNISGGTEVIDPELGEPITPFSLKNTTTDIEDNIQGTKTYKANYQYMGIYCDNDENPKTHQSWYTWYKIRGDKGIQGETGPQGPQGKQGEKGDKGDNFTGHSYTIDLEGDMSMIPINIDRKTNGSCKCVLHAYYGNNEVKLDKDKVEINISEEYKNIGVFEKEQSGNDVIIKFKPDENFVFPTTTIMFTIHVDDTVRDTSDNKIYRFIRDTVWMVKGIVSTFSLEIIPNSRTIKLEENGNYTPRTLIVDVYKYEDGKCEKFDLTNSDFELKYKTNTDNKWYTYNNGISTKKIGSCVELKVVKDEEIWDYEDVWVVADGKSTHYYHADLGAAESMMVLITGNEYPIDGGYKCAEIRINSSGRSEYSITFDITFFDGSTPCTPKKIELGSADELYSSNGTFERSLTKLTTTKDNSGNTKYISTLTITRVPANVEMIPMSFIVQSNSSDGNTIQDIIYFNVYISTLSDIFTLSPTKTSFNTSSGNTGDTIGCDVYKGITTISDSLTEYNLSLCYQKNGEGDPKPYVNPLTFGAVENGFVSSDKYIDFILYHTFTNPIDPNQKTPKEIAISTVPLIKDGINGVDGNSWQYIFCRSSKYPFDQTGFSYPSGWEDKKYDDPNNELLGNDNVQDKDWYDDHKGVDSKYRYEYQSYRKWDKDNKKWSKFGDPTLYSNYSESGSGYSVILSNPIAVIPVGNDGNWSTNENMSNQNDSTLVYLYNNSTDLSKFENVTIELPKDNIYVQKGNFTIDKYNDINQILFNPSVNGSVFSFDQNNQYKLPIKLTYDLGSDIDGDGYIDKFTTTIYWTLSPLKGIEDVELYVDKHIVNISESNTHTLKVGYDLTSNGSKTSIRSNNENENIKQYIIGFTENIEQTPKVITDWNNATYTFVDDNGNTKNCYVVLLNSNEKTIIDYDIITAVNNGEPGKSAIHLELTQDYIALPANPDTNTGGIHPEYKDSIQSQMKLYNGDTLITSGIKYSFKVNGESLNKNTDIIPDSEGIFTIPPKLIQGDTKIECIATYNEIDYHKTLFIDLEDTPYELKINTNILTRDSNGKITNDSLIVSVKYRMGGKWKYTTDGVVKAKGNKSSSTVELFTQDNTTVRTYIFAEDSPFNTNNDTEIRISYFDDNDNELSYKTIGIVSDGKKGDTVACDSVTVLGYSLSSEAKITDIIGDTGTWKPSLNKLGTVSPGATIYILNEYTWSNNTTSRVITSTLAGTQGVAGKSRVLFYLGSFKDGTLVGDTVEGLLTDDRCDYYIDANEVAWMRIGKNGKFPGYASVPNIPGLWQKADTVGFLKAGAIHADMINTGSLTAKSTFVKKLFSQEITADTLKVNAANISGELNIGEGNNQVKITKGAITAKMINATDLEVNAANISGELNIGEGNNQVKILDGAINGKKIAANSITADQIAANSITANEIDTTDLKVYQLDTKPDTGSKIKIKDNKVSIHNKNNNITCMLSDDIIQNVNTQKIFTGGDTSHNLNRDPISLYFPSKKSQYRISADESFIATTLGLLRSEQGITFNIFCNYNINKDSTATKGEIYINYNFEIVLYKNGNISDSETIKLKDGTIVWDFSNQDTTKTININIQNLNHKINSDGIYSLIYRCNFDYVINKDVEASKSTFLTTEVTNHTFRFTTPQPYNYNSIFENGIITCNGKQGGLVIDDDEIYLRIKNTYIKITENGIEYSINGRASKQLT